MKLVMYAYEYTNYYSFENMQIQGAAELIENNNTLEDMIKAIEQKFLDDINLNLDYEVKNFAMKWNGSFFENYIDKDAKVNFTGNDYSYPLRKEVVRQLEESKFDTTRTVLFGVRPEHVHIADKGIPAVVDVVEQLGDETIAYCKVEGIEKYIVLKTGLTGTIKRLDKVNLDFEADKVYMFDKESQHSIIGLPLLNKLPCKFLGNSVTVGEQVVELPTSFTSHLLETKNNENLFLGCRPSDVYLENVDDSHPIEVAVDFVDARTNYNVVYSKVKGVDGYLVFKAPKELELKDAIYNSSLHASDFKDRNDNRKMMMKIFGLDQVKIDNSIDIYEASGKNILARVKSEIDSDNGDSPVIPIDISEVEEEDK